MRELYKHAVSMGSLDGRVLDALFVVGDDRFYPAHVRREDGMLRTVLRPLHRVPDVRRASVDDAKPGEFQALLGACEHWRDRFLVAVMYFAGLRVGETLGLRLSDLHFAERSGALGCSYPGAHLHVVPRANVNGARVKNERARVVPVEGSLVGAFDHYLRGAGRVRGGGRLRFRVREPVGRAARDADEGLARAQAVPVAVGARRVGAAGASAHAAP